MIPLTKEQIQEVLRAPQAPYYIYRLWTPSNKVFYIGKGFKMRALCHEKEIYKPYYRSHTNWKKLNKIASILLSGGNISYDIESWHEEEESAFRREDRLIMLAERENAHILCNSNGQRSRGKPGRQLIELRTRLGLPI